MFARIVTTRSKSKTYRYAQLVESYRRKDGMPVHRVVANLGRVNDDTLVDNLNKAQVRAHVTLCMLGLLAQRTLHERLANRSGAQPELALQALEPCRLNAYAGSRPMYLLTTPDPAQNKLLRQLKLGYLVDEPTVAAQLTPRASFVTTRKKKTA